LDHFTVGAVAITIELARQIAGIAQKF